VKFNLKIKGQFKYWNNEYRNKIKYLQLPAHFVLKLHFRIFLFHFGPRVNVKKLSLILKDVHYHSNLLVSRVYVFNETADSKYFTVNQLI
jgi:hypothetical protein